MSKESKAIGYANRYAERDLQVVSKDSYLHGWNEALRSQWVCVEERLPEYNQDVLFLTDIGMIMNGHYDGNVWMQMDGVLSSSYSSINKCWSVIAWMPIPSFDDIIEANKDVLQRLKDN